MILHLLEFPVLPLEHLHLHQSPLGHLLLFPKLLLQPLVVRLELLILSRETLVHLVELKVLTSQSPRTVLGFLQFQRHSLHVGEKSLIILLGVGNTLGLVVGLEMCITLLFSLSRVMD